MITVQEKSLSDFRSRFCFVACFAWLAFSLSNLLLPGHEDRVLALTQPFALGEVATMLWLVIMGAKKQRLAAAS